MKFSTETIFRLEFNEGEISSLRAALINSYETENSKRCCINLESREFLQKLEELCGNYIGL